MPQAIVIERYVDDLGLHQSWELRVQLSVGHLEDLVELTLKTVYSMWRKHIHVH
jgi:hypothetical protein